MCHLVVLLDIAPIYHQEMQQFQSSVRVRIVVHNVPVTKIHFITYNSHKLIPITYTFRY